MATRPRAVHQELLRNRYGSTSSVSVSKREVHRVGDRFHARRPAGKDADDRFQIAAVLLIEAEHVDPAMARAARATSSVTTPPAWLSA